MAEAVHMGAGGFSVPPVPDGAQVHQRTTEAPPPAGAQQPGFVPPAPPAPAPAAGTFTQEQVQAMIAEALAKAQAPAPAPTPAAPALNPAATITAPAELATASDPVLSSMTAMFTGSAQGIDITRALGNALTHGDARLIDVAYIREKGGANAEHLVTLAQGIISRVEQQAAEGAKAVHAEAGGEQQWNVAVAAFNTHAPAHQKLVIRNMLDSGNPESIKAAAKSVVEFARSSGQVPVAPGLVHAGAGGAGAAQALDKHGFQQALRQLSPNSPGYEQARAELFQRRALGKSLNM